MNPSINPLSQPARRSYATSQHDYSGGSVQLYRCWLQATRFSGAGA